MLRLVAVNNMNPSLQLGEEGINSVLVTLEAIRNRALSIYFYQLSRNPSYR